ncbi:MAG: nucleotidyltransferase family protein [Acidobacteria bacterium]|nr:nucleotidyltransferase family protein [Acidobacteriota bacterium]
MATAPVGPGATIGRFPVYEKVLDQLISNDFDFLIGGGHAYNLYTKLDRPSRDFDIFVREEDCPEALALMERIGLETELSFPHWLGKAKRDDVTVDFIYGSGNGIAPVDEDWFRHAVEGELWGRRVRFCPVEELIWSKSFIMERERYDGAEIAHLFHSCAETLDWPRLAARFGEQWPVLLSHLVLFHFIYPFDRNKMPLAITQFMLKRFRSQLVEPAPERRICNGTLLSRAQYLIDIEEWGYLDARLEPSGRMKPDDVAHWTEAMRKEGIID